MLSKDSFLCFSVLGNIKKMSQSKTTITQGFPMKQQYDKILVGMLYLCLNPSILSPFYLDVTYGI